MAGAGYKLFNTGDVLTAAQVNTYLQEQAVMRFANSTARTTALSGVLAEGMVSYLDDTNAVEVYNGSAWVSVGSTGDITAVNVTSPITGGGSSGDVTISIQDGTTTQKGAVQLENSTSSTSTTTAAVPASVKSAYDLANAAIPKSLVDAAGDLIYATANDTVTRLGIGTANQVLRVNSGATAPEWATVGAGSFTKITGNTFSNQSSVTIDSIFSSTYRCYMMILALNATSPSTNVSDAQLQFRYGSTTLTGSNYYGAQYNLTRGNSASTNGYSAATQITMAPDVGGPDNPSFYTIFFRKVGSTSERAHLYGTYLGGGSTDSGHFSGQTDTNQTYTGILLKASANNIDGNYTIYGLEN